MKQSGWMIIGESNVAMLLGINGDLIVHTWKVNMAGIVLVAAAYMMKIIHVVMDSVMAVKH